MKSYTQSHKEFLSAARNNLVSGLEQCTDEQQLLFKRMYAHGHLDWSIRQVVAHMAVDKLDWATQQVQRTIEKHK